MPRFPERSRQSTAPKQKVVSWSLPHFRPKDGGQSLGKVAGIFKSRRYNRRTRPINESIFSSEPDPGPILVEGGRFLELRLDREAALAVDIAPERLAFRSNGGVRRIFRTKNRKPRLIGPDPASIFFGGDGGEPFGKWAGDAV